MGCLGRKYTSLGLIAWYDLSGDKKALEAACRVVDHLMTQVGPGKVDIVSTGNYIGMPSSSVLEPVMYLYNRTKEKRYLDLPNILSDNGRHPVLRTDQQSYCRCARSQPVFRIRKLGFRGKTDKKLMK